MVHSVCKQYTPEARLEVAVSRSVWGGLIHLDVVLVFYLSSSSFTNYVHFLRKA